MVGAVVSLALTRRMALARTRDRVQSLSEEGSAA
jgi:hypothetical protein